MQMNKNIEELGASITRAASLQTYYTVRFLVDRNLVPAAYRAYAYFRWVDDWLDEPTRERRERLEFVKRQTSLVEACYRGNGMKAAVPQEHMLIELVQADGRKYSGLQSYVRNMMWVMEFDAERRGRLISAAELKHYQCSLAVAVTEAMHYFIGHGSASPHGSTRYLAVEGAHIVHMLRDALDDSRLGYFNIPREYLKVNGASPENTESGPYREWVRSRVELARSYFRAGRNYLSQVQNRRCRLAGHAYMARFETVLDCIERDGYVLRPEYHGSKSAAAGALMGWSVLCSTLSSHRPVTDSGALIVR